MRMYVCKECAIDACRYVHVQYIICTVYRQQAWLGENMDKQNIEKAALSITQSCHYLGGISRPHFYRLLGQGVIRSFHIGARRFCLKRDLDAYIENRLEEEGYT